MTRISDLTLPVLQQTIHGIVHHVPCSTIDRVPTTEYIVGDDSGDIRVIYAQDGEFKADMYELEDGNRVELTGVGLPIGKSGVKKFLAMSGRRERKL